jgi:hypothetical protein
VRLAIVHLEAALDVARDGLPEKQHVLLEDHTAIRAWSDDALRVYREFAHADRCEARDRADDRGSPAT